MPTAPLGRPGDRNAIGVSHATSTGIGRSMRSSDSSTHPLTDSRENNRLYDYECSVKEAFDAIVPTLKKISAVQHDADFEQQAQSLAQQNLGFSLNPALLNDAWVDQLDMRSLFAWCVFETYHRFCD